jgi:hypothetical protein
MGIDGWEEKNGIRYNASFVFLATDIFVSHVNIFVQVMHLRKRFSKIVWKAGLVCVPLPDANTSLKIPCLGLF